MYLNILELPQWICLILIRECWLYLDPRGPVLASLGRSALFIRGYFVIHLHNKVAQFWNRSTHHTSWVLPLSGGIIVFCKGRFSYQDMTSRSSSFEVDLERPISSTRSHFPLSQLRCLWQVAWLSTNFSKINSGYLVIRWARYVGYITIMPSTRVLVRYLIRGYGHFGALEARTLTAYSTWVLHGIIFLF